MPEADGASGKREISENVQRMPARNRARAYINAKCINFSVVVPTFSRRFQIFAGSSLSTFRRKHQCPHAHRCRIPKMKRNSYDADLVVAAEYRGLYLRCEKNTPLTLK